MFLVSTNDWLKICVAMHRMYSFLYPCIEITCDMDQPCMSCCMMITRAMYLLLYHHYVLVESPIFSMICHYGDRFVMEEYHEFILHPYIWANDDVIVMMYHVFDSLVHRG